MASGNFLDNYLIYDQMTAMEALSPFSHGRQNCNVLRHAGTWLAANPDAWQNGKILVNDVMAPFFAGMSIEEYLVFNRQEKYNFSLMEKWALKNNVDTLVIKLPNDRQSLLNALSGYQPIKQISGKNRSVYIYGLPDTVLKTDA